MLDGGVTERLTVYAGSLLVVYVNVSRIPIFLIPRSG